MRDSVQRCAFRCVGGRREPPCVSCACDLGAARAQRLTRPGDIPSAQCVGSRSAETTSGRKPIRTAGGCLSPQRHERDTSPWTTGFPVRHRTAG